MSEALRRNFESVEPSRVPWLTRLRAALALLTQLALLAAALWLALAIRFDFHLAAIGPHFWPLLPLVLTLKLAVWLASGLHRGANTWRYVGLGDLLRLLAASLIALGLVIAAYNSWQLLALWGYLPPPSAASLNAGPLPESLFILDWLLSLSLIAAVRIAARLTYEESRPIAPGGIVRLLIIGAGDAAITLLREIARMPEQHYRIVGLLDDDPAKARTRLAGVPVLGPISALPSICQSHQIGEILIALPSATNQQMQRIISLCRATQMAHDMRQPGAASSALRFRTIPSLQDILVGRAGAWGPGGGAGLANQIRDISVNDLLGRDAVQTDLAAVGALLHQQVVLVSGAGGSIGSELCRTICRFDPALLVLLDKAENAVFEIERELRKTFPTIRLAPAIGDISDAIRVDQVFADYAPAIVFHAAAHKHVPLAESNPGEAIRNNVFGTKILADAAAAAGVRRFVMISTDKAVNPSSIMGATKRCAELYINGLARRCQGGGGETHFITVRFGNVLGSNGSVVPIFKQQIALGGPVTVTHPEMRRYFMTIPEASQLVLQAAALGQRAGGGEVFLLDMGQPVRILDLARDLIILSGLRPDVDIPIVFTGLRPGEKLYEELSIRGENMAPTRHPKIAVWKSPPPTPQYVQRMIDDLEPLQHCTSRPRVLATLKAFIPEMKPWEEPLSPPQSETHSPPAHESRHLHGEG